MACKKKKKKTLESTLISNPTTHLMKELIYNIFASIYGKIYQLNLGYFYSFLINIYKNRNQGENLIICWQFNIINKTYQVTILLHKPLCKKIFPLGKIRISLHPDLPGAGSDIPVVLINYGSIWMINYTVSLKHWLSKCGPQTSGIIIWKLVRMQIISPTPDSLNQKL